VAAVELEEVYAGVVPQHLPQQAVAPNQLALYSEYGAPDSASNVGASTGPIDTDTATGKSSQKTQLLVGPVSSNATHPLDQEQEDNSTLADVQAEFAAPVSKCEDTSTQRSAQSTSSKSSALALLSATLHEHGGIDARAAQSQVETRPKIAVSHHNEFIAALQRYSRGSSSGLSDVAHLHKPESSGGLHAGSADIRSAKVAAVAPPAAAVEVESTTPATGEHSTGLTSCCGPLPASASDDRAGGDSESPSASASAWAGFLNTAGHVRTHADNFGAGNAGPADVQETAAVASLYSDHCGAVCADDSKDEASHGAHHEAHHNACHGVRRTRHTTAAAAGSWTGFAVEPERDTGAVVATAACRGSRGATLTQEWETDAVVDHSCVEQNPVVAQCDRASQVPDTAAPHLAFADPSGKKLARSSLGLPRLRGQGKGQPGDSASSHAAAVTIQRRFRNRKPRATFATGDGDSLPDVMAEIEDLRAEMEAAGFAFEECD
jgi:hypothetical protein